MRPVTVISLLAGAGALAMAMAPAPEESLPGGGPTIAEARLIQHIRELAQAPADDDLSALGAGLNRRDLTQPSDAQARELERVSLASADLASIDEQSAAEPVPPQPAGSAYVVVAEALNVRAAPSGSSSVVGRLLQGEQVVVVEQERGWMRVSGGSAEGWAFSRYLASAE